MSEILVASGLTRRFRATLAVDQVDLTVRPGERHALIGPNGAGKSTLLNLLAGALRPNAGHIHLRGHEITRVPPAARARLGLARTFQTPAVFGSLSTLENLTVAGWRGNRRNLGHESLEMLGLGDCTHRPAHALSHGQRRLLEIAMALQGTPQIVLMDEPAAGLGDEDLRRLVDFLRRLPSQIAVLLVEHNQEVVAAVADTVTVLHRGRVLVSGTPRQVHEHPAVAEIYLGSKAVG